MCAELNFGVSLAIEVSLESNSYVSGYREEISGARKITICAGNIKQGDCNSDTLLFR